MQVTSGCGQKNVVGYTAVLRGQAPPAGIRMHSNMGSIPARPKLGATNWAVLAAAALQLDLIVLASFLVDRNYRYMR